MSNLFIYSCLSSSFFIAVPASCSWAAVVETNDFKIQHSPFYRDRHWLKDLFRSLHTAFEKNPGAYNISLPHSCLCDAAFVNEALEDGRRCSCPSSLQFREFDVSEDVQKSLLRSRNAVGLVSNADRKPDRISILRLHEG